MTELNRVISVSREEVLSGSRELSICQLDLESVTRVSFVNSVILGSFESLAVGISFQSIVRCSLGTSSRRDIEVRVQLE